ncbi:MAG: hypothetical protein ACJZ64_03240, partial [Opitutales bacterium]
FHKADSYTRTLSLSSGETLSTGLDNGVRIVFRSTSCHPVSKLGSTHPFLFHSMTLHFTERIIISNILLRDDLHNYPETFSVD